MTTPEASVTELPSTSPKEQKVGVESEAETEVTSTADEKNEHGKRNVAGGESPSETAPPETKKAKIDAPVEATQAETKQAETVETASPVKASADSEAPATAESEGADKCDSSAPADDAPAAAAPEEKTAEA
eukprot:Gregarina_sp_Poly_1__4604@NODE_2467_length_2082_cov_217_117122_g1562_i0_p3_GENE_NODE_2467_length_2082_cov_217_117122_g1562_i0NODE_2467_length_2082_cov_217_117122_g1562_i0_p3_ORF_typecomplete_len138_score35_39_NODE_2467_length_2082_cov_217_117122_g1562_i022414